jgi:thiamine biosynthesis lipoprotein
VIRAALLACLALACAGPGLHVDGRVAMGTVLEITLSEDHRGELGALFKRADALEQVFTSFDPASELSELNRGAGGGAQTVSPELAQLLADAIRYNEVTRGSFDVTVGPLMTLWAEAGRRGSPPSADELARAQAVVGTRHLRADPAGPTAEIRIRGASVDLGGVAKGFALDDLGEGLHQRGVTRALLSFGQSSVLALGAPPDARGWRMRVRGADDDTAGFVELRDVSLSVSSSLSQLVEIGGVKYGHLIDPRSGQPLQRRGVAAVIASSCARAEALSKAMLILPPDEGLALLESLDDAEGLLIDFDGAQRMTSGWQSATGFRAQDPSKAIR